MNILDEIFQALTFHEIPEQEIISDLSMLEIRGRLLNSTLDRHQVQQINSEIPEMTKDRFYEVMALLAGNMKPIDQRGKSSGYKTQEMATDEMQRAIDRDDYRDEKKGI